MLAHSPGDSTHPERLGWQSLMEWLAIAVASALWLFLAARHVWSGGLDASFWWVTALGAAVGYLAGGLISGEF